MRRFWEGVRADVAYMYQGHQRSVEATVFFWIVAICDRIKSGAGSIVCWKFGHKLVDESSGGPDSGDMDHSCRRCGRSWSAPLY